MTNKFTYSLNMIVKNEVNAVVDLLRHNSEAMEVFDAIYITVSDKRAYNALKIELDYPVFHLDYRPWNNKFDDARNHNWELSAGYDFSMWLDADDTFDFRVMPRLKEMIQSCDAIYLPYHYDHDEDGNVIVSHWRERLVRRSIGWTWKGWVHETLIPDSIFEKEMVNAPVIHHSDHRDESIGRNHEILVAAYKETKDPRYIHYLGISYFTQKKWDEAIQVLSEYIEVGGWDEEIYRSLLKISEAYYNKKDFDSAGRYALEAIGFMPELPMAYHNLAQYEFKQKNYKQALEWVKVAVQKPAPKNVSIFDPTQNNRSLLTGALCEYELGNYREATELLKKVTVVDVSDLLPDFEYQASVDRLKDILPALFKHYKDPRVLWDSLNDGIKYDNRFRVYREQFTKPKFWGEKSIVFFCGKGYEEWGAHTLAKGMGGSEEAVVYLSREFAKLGYEVTVYGEVPEPYMDGKVEYLPWKYIDKRDIFRTLIVWRSPQLATQFKAQRLLVDMHDKLPEAIVKQYANEIYMFKSKYHQELYPQVKDSHVVGNGILKEQFANKVAKKKHTVGYFSAYYRGLETLLDMWLEIRKQVPKAKLDIYYGWESWVNAEGEDDFYERMVKKINSLKNHGVTEHGRVDHKTLAKKMQKTAVWAYPTEFEEIHCITALKAREANCKTVYTTVAALNETARGIPVDTQTIYTDTDKQQEFIKAVVSSLTKDVPMPDKVKNRYWSEVAKQWLDVIEG